MKERFCALFLSFALVLGLLPGAALAAEAGKTQQSDSNGAFDASMEALLSGIAAGYTRESGEWVILDMAAYEDLCPETQYKTTDTTRQTYINYAIESVTAEGAGETAFAKAILILQSIGADARKLYPKQSLTSISAVEGLLSLAEYSSSAWAAPYTLAALNQGDYGTDELEQTILSSVLANQAGDGSWSEWGDSIQTTANMLAGLAFYYGEDETVTAAVDKAVEFLSAAQKADGSFDAYGTGSDSNTAAMVVIALSALGIDPDTDPRFVKDGNSVMDALLSFAVADASGFGYTDNTAVNSYSTEQGFRALIAANRVMQTGSAYNIYDFSGNKGKEASASAGLPGKHPDVSASQITQDGKTFSDIARHPNQTAVEELARRGLVSGGDGGLFAPDAGMTRAEFAAIVVTALGLTPSAEEVFSDVSAEDWFAPYVGTACAYGIVSGTGEGRFSPHAGITRQEAACMMARAAGLCGVETEMTQEAVRNMLAQFSDYMTCADWAKGALALCYRENILSQSELDIQPYTVVTRGEMAQMMYNLLLGTMLL